MVYGMDMTNTQNTTQVLEALTGLGGERLWGEVWEEIHPIVSNPATFLRRLVISGQVIEGNRNGMRTFRVAA